MRTRGEQIAELVDALKKPVCRPDYPVSILEGWLKHHILEAEARGIAAIKSSAKTAQEDERPDIRKWQEDQKEWFDPTIREIVAEYAAWRDQQDKDRMSMGGQDQVEEMVAKISDLASNGFCVDYETVERWVRDAEQRVRAEIAQDRDRLNWLEAEVAATGIVSLSAVMREDGDTVFYCTKHRARGSSTSLRNVIDIARGLAEAEDRALDRTISNHDC